MSKKCKKVNAAMRERRRAERNPPPLTHCPRPECRLPLYRFGTTAMCVCGFSQEASPARR